MSIPRYAVAVDLVILTVRHEKLQALIVERGIPPFTGQPALPGGFVTAAEDLDQAAKRELREETGIELSRGHLEQLASYGRPDRDPRQRVISIAYLALAPDLPTPQAGTDAAAASWIPVEKLVGSDAQVQLAFDHAAIFADGVERARAKLEYTALATTFCPETFTIGELRQVYEAVWGQNLDPRNFHRKATNTTGFILETGQTTKRGGGRPAQLYRSGPTRQLIPPLVRPGQRN